MSCKRSVEDTYLSPAEKALSASETFVIDYSDELADFDPVDTIVASSWAVTKGTVTAPADSFTDNTTQVRVAGGTKIGELNRLTNTVTTSNGDTLVRTLTVKIVNVHAKRQKESEITFSTPTPL